MSGKVHVGVGTRRQTQKPEQRRVVPPFREVGHEPQRERQAGALRDELAHGVGLGVHARAEQRPQQGA